MDIYAFPPIAAALDAAYTGLTAAAQMLEPVAGTASVALSIALVTLLVRAAMIPLGRAQVRAEFVRRRIAPKLRALQKRYAKQPEVLQRKTLELYREEGTSPLAGMWTVLVQAPVVGLLYAVFTHPSIAGHGNALLTARLGGVPLGHGLGATLLGGPAWPGLTVVLAVLAALAVTAALSRRQAVRLAERDGTLTPLVRGMSWLSFLTLAFALIAPLAAGVYLVVTTTWTLVERTVLRRVLDPSRAPVGQPRPAAGPHVSHGGA